MAQYTEEEQKIINDLHSQKYTKLEGKELEEMKTFLLNGARNKAKELGERKAISIRLFKNDIHKIQNMALKEGIPYQTFITSVLHKVANSGNKSLDSVFIKNRI